MLQYYNPVSGAFVNTNGSNGVSTDGLLVNILIELRVMNAIALDAQRGLVTGTLEQYRSDAVNATVNPSI